MKIKFKKMELMLNYMLNASSSHEIETNEITS